MPTTDRHTTIVLKTHPSLPKLEGQIISTGLDWLLKNTTMLTGYEFGIDPERVETKFCVILMATGQGELIGLGPTLTAAANNALELLDGWCHCPDDDWMFDAEAEA